MSDIQSPFSSPLGDDSTVPMPTINLQLRMTEDKKVAYTEDEDGVLYSIIFPSRIYAEAPSEIQGKYNESDYNGMVQTHYDAAVSFVQERMKADVALAHRIVRMLAGY